MLPSDFRQLNKTMLAKLLVASTLMFGFGFAMVPIYQKICEVTGVNVLTQRDERAEAFAKNTQVDSSRSITIEFDANAHGLKPHCPSNLNQQCLMHQEELI